MKSLKGTKTAENLLKSFAGESQARNMYASVAKMEGYIQSGNIFTETAGNGVYGTFRIFQTLN